MKAIEIAICMIAGVVMLVVLFALRLVALIAGVIGGFSLLGMLMACGAWSATPNAMHWANLTKSVGLTATCIAVVVIAGFGPMWVFSKPNPVRPRRA